MKTSYKGPLPNTRSLMVCRGLPKYLPSSNFLLILRLREAAGRLPRTPRMSGPTTSLQARSAPLSHSRISVWFRGIDLSVPQSGRVPHPNRSSSRLGWDTRDLASQWVGDPHLEAMWVRKTFSVTPASRCHLRILYFKTPAQFAVGSSFTAGPASRAKISFCTPAGHLDLR